MKTIPKPPPVSFDSLVDEFTAKIHANILQPIPLRDAVYMALSAVARWRMDQDEAKAKELRDALQSIASIGGNLPDDRLTDKTGPNDAAHRGLMYVNARNIARKALGEA